MLTRARLISPVNPADFSASDGRPRQSATDIARYLHALTARGHTGVLFLRGKDAETLERRIGLRKGWVYAIDAGPSAPVSPEAQLRYLLRQRGRLEFQPATLLSARYGVDEFRPDGCIRQHIEAQALPTEPLRQRIGMQRISVVIPPHDSVLHVEEQELVRYLGEPRTVPELLEQGAQRGTWSPLRAMRLLVLLDALGALVIGAHGGALASAYALLGLDGAATLEEIKGAYRRLARTLHPDSRPELPAAAQRELTERFSELAAAYRLLVQHMTLGK